MRKITSFLFTAIISLIMVVNTNAQYLFEPFDGGLGSIPAGWTNEPTNNYDWQFLATTASSGGPIAADHTTGMGFFAYFNSWSANDGDVGELTSPLVDLSTSTTPMLAFAWNRPNTGYTARLEVDVFSGGAWSSDIYPGLNYQTTGWEIIEINVSAYKTNDFQIRFRVVGDYYRNIAIDDVLLIEMPTDQLDWNNLQSPATIVMTEGDAGTAVFARATEAGVTDTTFGMPSMGIQAWIGYSTTDTDPSTWTNWIPAAYTMDFGNDDEYMAVIGDGFAPGTYYYASRFRLNGGPYSYGGFDAGFWDGTTNVSGVLTVNEAVVAAFPWCEGFEGSPFFETTGWSVVNNNADADTWNVNTSATYVHSGAQSAAMYTDFNSANDDWLITPAIALTGNEQLKFWMRARSTSEPDEVQVLLSTTDKNLTSFTEVLLPSTPVAYTTFAETILDLSAYSGNVYVAFVRNQAPADGWYLYLDDVCVQEIPACPSPTALGVTTISDNSAEVIWTTGGAPNADIQYGLQGFGLGSGTIVADVTNPYLIGGLNAETAYDFYVRDSCGMASSSAWTGPFTFTTLLAPINVPTGCEIGLGLVDNNCQSVPFLVSGAPGTQLGTDVLVESIDVILSHTYDSDVTLTLVSPNGVSVVLTDGNGGSSDHYGLVDGTCTQMTTFNMSGVNGLISSGIAPFVGSFAPEGDFASYNDGSDPNGVWTLEYCDAFGGDVGTLQYFDIVLRAPSTETEILSYAFPEATGPATIDNMNFTIDIEVLGTASLNNLVADFMLSSGANAFIAGTIQESGMTANDFSGSVVYDVVAEDGITTQAWTVNVTQAVLNDQADILSYSIPGASGPSMIDDVNHEIYVWMPFGTDPSALVADFAASMGATVEVSGMVQQSGVTQNDFTGPVVYTVTSEDAMNVINWTVFLDVLPADPGTDCSNPILASEGINDADNSAGDQWFYFVAPVTGMVTVNSCGITGEDTRLYLYSDCSTSIVDVDDNCSFGAQETLEVIVLQNDTLIIQWGDNFTSAMYQWELSFRLLNTGANIDWYSFNEQTGPAAIDNINHTIDVEVAYGTDITNLVADFALSMGATAEVNASMQIPGGTANDFSSPVVYTVTSEDGNTVIDWTVYVTVKAPNTESDIVWYTFPEATGVFNYDYANKTIHVEVGIGTDLTQLVGEFQLSEGATAAISGTPQFSGVTMNDFTGFVIYTITAEDGVSTTDWAIDAYLATQPNHFADILSYGFPEQTGPAVIDPNNHTINIEVGWYADITNLVADFSLSFGASAQVDFVAQVSGTTVNDFTNEVLYEVTAQDGSTVVNWIVYVSQEPVPAGYTCEYASEAFEGMNWAENPGGDFYAYYVAPAPGEVTISSCGFTNLDTYLYIYETDCATQVDATDDDCSLQSQGTYQVVADDTLIIMWGDNYDPVQFDYTISFMAYSSDADIVIYSFPEQTGPAVIDNMNNTVEIEVANGSNLSGLVADFTLSMGASASIGAVPQVSGVTANDFTMWQTYTVTAEDGITTKDWTVMVTELMPQLLINEVDVDGPGTDADEFIELYDGGVGNVALDGFVVVLYNGATDAVYNAIDLDGYTTNPEGYFVIGSATVPNVDYVFFTTNGIQNGQDAVALYQGDAVAFPNGSGLVINSNLVDALVYGTGDAFDPELATLLIINQPQIDESANGNSVGESMQRIPNGEGGLQMTETYAVIPPTPGTMNMYPPVTDLAIGFPPAGYSLSCNMGVEQIPLGVGNAGETIIPMGDTIFGFFQINGGAVVADTFIVYMDMNPGDDMFFMFNEFYDFGTTGFHDYSVWFSYEFDEISSNDTVVGQIESYDLLVEISQGDVLQVVAGDFPQNLTTVDSYSMYTWSNEAGTLIGHNPSYNVYNFGWYYVEVENGEGCVAMDSILVEEILPYVDLAIVTPTDGDYFEMCDLTADQMAMLEFENQGTGLLPAGDTVFFFYEVNSGGIVADTLIMPMDLNPGEMMSFAFDVTFDASAFGAYDFMLSLDYSEDTEPWNNMVYGTMEHIDFGVAIEQGDTVAIYAYEFPVMLNPVDYYDSYYWENFDGSVFGDMHEFYAYEFGWHYLEVSTGMNCFAYDSVYIEEIPPAAYDVALIDPPYGQHSGAMCDLGMIQLEWMLQNVGVNAIPTGDTLFLYSGINADPILVDTVVLGADWQPGDTLYSLSNHILDLVALGNYDVYFEVEYDGDMNLSNNVSDLTLNHIELNITIDSPDTVYAYAYELPISLNTNDVFDEYYWRDEFGNESFSQTFDVVDFGWVYLEGNDYSVGECNPIDSVLIIEIPPAAIDLAITYPVATFGEFGCGLGIEPIDVEITNVGTDAITAGSAINFSYQVNADPVVTETLVTSADILSGETVAFTFAQDLDMTGLGMYDYAIWIELTGDMNADNDTVMGSFDHIVIDVQIDAPDTVSLYGFQLPYELTTVEMYDNYSWADEFGTNGSDPAFWANDFGWVYVTASFDSTGCMDVDSVFIEEIIAPATDLAVYSDYFALELCNLGVEYPGSLAMINVGSTEIPAGDTIFINYNIEGTLFIDTLVLVDPITVGGYYVHSYENAYDFSVPGFYTMNAWFEYDGDLDPNNNETLLELTHIEYILDLENTNGAVMDTLEVMAYPATLDAGAGFMYYGWSTGDNTQTTTVFMDGWYYAQVWSDDGCYDEDSIFVMYYTGINEEGNSDMISVYPNPANTFINVQVSTVSSSFVLELIDIQGQTVYTENQNIFGTINDQIDISSLANGVYYLRVSTDESVTVHKVIKQ